MRISDWSSDVCSSDLVERVQRGLGVLEYHADVAATDAAKLLVRQVVDAAAVEAARVAGNAAGGVQESDHSRAGQRLAGAGLADHAQHLALADLKGDAVDRNQGAAPAGDLDAQVLDLEQRPHQRSFGFRASRSQSPNRLTASTRMASAAPGKMVIHHEPENRKSLTTQTRVQSDGRADGTPRPRNGQPAPAMTAKART